MFNLNRYNALEFGIWVALPISMNADKLARLVKAHNKLADASNRWKSNGCRKRNGEELPRYLDAAMIEFEAIRNDESYNREWEQFCKDMGFCVSCNACDYLA